MNEWDESCICAKNNISLKQISYTYYIDSCSSSVKITEKSNERQSYIMNIQKSQGNTMNLWFGFRLWEFHAQCVSHQINRVLWYAFLVVAKVTQGYNLL